MTNFDPPCCCEDAPSAPYWCRDCVVHDLPDNYPVVCPKHAVDRRSDFEIIRSTLADIYGGGEKGDMVYSLAEHLTEKLPMWITEADGQSDEPNLVEYELHMQIWHWFPGGSTAEVAARNIIAALENAS